MHTQQASRSYWLQAYILGASALIILISAGNLLLFTQALPDLGRGIAVENAIMLSGVFIALPAGLLNVGLGISGLKNDHSAAGRTVAIIGIIAGAFGLLTGFFWYGALLALFLGAFR